VTLGEKLRAVRKERGLTLQQVASASGLSKAFVSQIESGTANPSLASLKRVGNALSLPLAALFESEGNGAEPPAPGPEREEEVRVVRRDRRKQLVWPGRSAPSYLLTPDLRGKLEVLLDVVEPGQEPEEPDGGAMTHEGEEFGFILEGRYEISVGGRAIVLEEGDSITFPSRLPHRGRALGDRTARTLWVITPPSF
jgi:transcriptional regulator with XRE-family HTH domain